MEPFLEAIPLIVAALAPPLVMFVRERVAALVPDRYVPILLPALGGFLVGIAPLVGVDPGGFTPETADLTAWQELVTAILVGFAAVGVHQAGKQLRKRDDDPHGLE